MKGDNSVAKFSNSTECPATRNARSIPGVTPADNQVRRLFRHHQHAGVDVRTDEIRHRRRIDHAQRFNASHPEFRIEHRIRMRSQMGSNC